MVEAEVETTSDAAHFLATEVVNEYFAFPVVQRADFGVNSMFIMLNDTWFRFDVSAVPDNGSLVEDLERLAG